MISTWQELAYEYKADETWKTWPVRQSLTDFTQSAAKIHITNVVDDYFQQLSPEHQRLQLEVMDIIHAAHREFDALRDVLRIYNTTTVVGSEFVQYVSNQCYELLISLMFSSIKIL